jgi:hypothetical protein
VLTGESAEGRCAYSSDPLRFFLFTSGKALASVMLATCRSSQIRIHVSGTL